MQKFVLLMAAISLFGAACNSDTTIDMGADSGVQATDPTAAPEPTALSTDATTATAVPAEEPASAPAELDTTAAEAVQMVVDAGDWCTAANAVENGMSGLDTLSFTDPIAVERGIRQSLAVILASKRLVPNEISADLDETIEAFTVLATALEDVNWVFLDLDLSVLDGLDGAIELATYNIESYNFIECGIGPDPGAPPVISDDGTVEGDAELPELNGTIREQAVQGLVEGGFSVEEANCILIDLDFTDPAAMSDLTALLDVFADCGISLDRLAQLGGQ